MIAFKPPPHADTDPAPTLAYVARGRPVERLRLGAALNPPDVKTFYGGDDHGYTDYPTLGASGAT